MGNSSGRSYVYLNDPLAIAILNYALGHLLAEVLCVLCV